MATNQMIHSLAKYTIKPQKDRSANLRWISAKVDHLWVHTFFANAGHNVKAILRQSNHARNEMRKAARG